MLSKEVLKKTLDQAKKANLNSDATETYQAALLGLWARDVVMPFLRKLPAGTTYKIPDANGNAVDTTIEAEVAKVFKDCPQ